MVVHSATKMQCVITNNGCASLYCRLTPFMIADQVEKESQSDRQIESKALLLTIKPVSFYCLAITTRFIGNLEASLEIDFCGRQNRPEHRNHIKRGPEAGHCIGQQCVLRERRDYRSGSDKQ